ncbi:MAG: hypothetical protein H7222_01960 [Methylotenera sp.]|nr:hypothetical protein [Oligoflexia bacterium]
MIYISEDQLNQVEYLIDQSRQGNHVLFDAETIKRVFNAIPRVHFPNEEQCYTVEHHIERLIEKPSLMQKRAYLEQLDTDTFDLVVRTYFNIVENKMHETQTLEGVH